MKPRVCHQTRVSPSVVPEHVVRRAGRVVARGHAGVHAVGALQAQRVIGLLSG